MGFPVREVDSRKMAEEHTPSGVTLSLIAQLLVQGIRSGVTLSYGTQADYFWYAVAWCLLKPA